MPLTDLDLKRRQQLKDAQQQLGVQPEQTNQYSQHPKLRDQYEDVGWDSQSHQVTIGGAQFQQGEIPGTIFDPKGHHHVTDREALDAAIKAQQGQGGQPPGGGDGHSLQGHMTQETQDIIQQLKDYIGTPHKTPDEVLQSDYGQQLMGSADAIRDQQMRQARAQLAGAGALYPDDTRAADRFAQVGAEAARMQAGQILPQLLQATQRQRGLGLNELQTMLAAQSGEEARAIQEAINLFQAQAPYTLLTEEQKHSLPLQWTQTMGEVPGGDVSPGGDMVPARVYTGQRGGTIDWRRAPDGTGNVVTINGHDIDVEAVGGRNVDGTVYLPKEVIEAALGAG